MTSTDSPAMPRTDAQVREHYELEKQLARQLMAAQRDERRHLYSALYDKLFRRLPHHPQWARKASEAQTQRSNRLQFAQLKPHLRPDTVYLEVGAGDCRFAAAVAAQVKQVYAVDVSDEITRGKTFPANLRVVLSDGCSIPVAPGSVTVAYSNQLMEHLHPDDAREQLRKLFTALAPGGVYVCCTPNRLTGPHDVSRGFDPVATGFHLKEYTARELAGLFQEAGFAQTLGYMGIASVVVRVPMAGLLLFERFLASSWAPRRGLAGRLMTSLSNIRLVGRRGLA